MPALGKMLVVTGAVIVMLGLLLMFAGRANLPLGHLPGDIVYRGRNVTFFFPLATCIILSVVLSLIFYFFGRFGR